MKTLGILIASLTLAGLALGLGLGLRSGLSLTGPAAPQAVTFTLRSPDSPLGSLDLTPQERDAVNRALALQGRRIASVQLHAGRTAAADPVRTGRTGPWAAFSLELTMADGATLASRVRRVPRHRLGAAVAECVADCLRAYDAQQALGRQVSSLTNI